MSKPNEDRDVYYIPPNFLTSGRLFGGMIRARNAIEACVLVLLTGVPIIKLPFSLTTRIIILCLVSLPLGIFGVIGFEGDSLSEFAVNWVRWLIHRRTLYRSDTPVPEAPEKPMKAVSGMSAPKPPEQLGIKIKENPKKRKKRNPVKKPHKASKHKSSVAKKKQPLHAEDFIPVRDIRNGITKMLCAQGAAGVLRDFADVLAVPIPELTPMFGFPQHNPHHDKDVWDHTIAVIESITPEPVLRWAALLHDIGKPSCFSLAEDGIGHFFGHSDQSTSMAESILSRLRFDNASKEQIVRLVRYHDMPITADRKPIKRLLSKHGEDATRQLIELHKADTLGQSAICRHRIAIFEEVSQMINEILQEESCFTLKDLAVNGHDMMTLGFQGPTIGRVLQECLDAVLDEQIPNEHEALMAFAKDRQLKS